MTMTLREAVAKIGETVLVTIHLQDKLEVPCEILDAKQGYGMTRFLIRPVGGKGQAWVEQYRISAYCTPYKEHGAA